MRSNLTTKMGDSGSAGSLGEKCVIIEALKIHSKMIKNSSTTLKMIKNNKKTLKSKNRKK